MDFTDQWANQGTQLGYCNASERMQRLKTLRGVIQSLCLFLWCSCTCTDYRIFQHLCWEEDGKCISLRKWPENDQSSNLGDGEYSDVAAWADHVTGVRPIGELSQVKSGRARNGTFDHHQKEQAQGAGNSSTHGVSISNMVSLSLTMLPCLVHCRLWTAYHAFLSCIFNYASLCATSIARLVLLWWQFCEGLFQIHNNVVEAQQMHAKQPWYTSERNLTPQVESKDLRMQA